VLRLEDGWDAIRVSEVGMSQGDDEEILRFSRQHNRIYVTLDHDFHTPVKRVVASQYDD